MRGDEVIENDPRDTGKNRESPKPKDVSYEIGEEAQNRRDVRREVNFIHNFLACARPRVHVLSSKNSN